MRTTIDGSRPTTKRALFKLWRSEREHPEPYYEALAARTVDGFPFPLERRRVLDLGSGPGYFSRALQDAGASIVAVESAAGALPGTGLHVACADAERLPFRAGSFDGVFCSNMLEHTPSPALVFSELARIVRPGGWAWVSWTNWYSPWGGHAITPLHYLGPRVGLRAYRLLRGEPRGRNIPFKN